MHNWGDNWFNEHGKHLHGAISEIESYLHRHHIGICGKEKWGCYRDEYLRFWNGGIYQILFGYRMYVGPRYHRYLYKYRWLGRIIYKIHCFIYFKIDQGDIPIIVGESLEEYHSRYNNRKWKGLCHYIRKTRLYRYIIKQQEKHYNYAFQLACKKYPDVIDELISDIDGYEMVKPCKYGDVSGVEIHNKYWKVCNDD